MNITIKGLDLIKKFEGCRLKAYKDPVGVWTIGYGHTSGVYEGMKITAAQAEDFLFEDVQGVVAYLNSKKREWTQNEFDALISFGYNCGVGNLRKLITGRGSEEIADAMLKYKFAGGKVLRGLEKRRQEERRLFLSEEETFVPPTRYVTGIVDNTKCYKLNVREEPSKSAKVLTVIDMNTEHQIDVDKSVSEYWYLTQFKGYVKKDFIKIKE